eukprot:31146-Chlamydomonas_euryale.AAC.5
MPAVSAARRKGSKSGLGAVTKGTPLRAVLNHPIPTPHGQAGRENWAQSCNGPVPPRTQHDLL